MRAIQHPDIPTPAGHYSPIVEHGGVLYVSGQLPAEEDGAFPEGIEAQTLSALGKVRGLVEAAGSRLEDIIQVRIYVCDVELWGAVNETYAGFFGAHRPARIVVPTGPAPRGLPRGDRGHRRGPLRVARPRRGRACGHSSSSGSSPISRRVSAPRSMIEGTRGSLLLRVTLSNSRFSAAFWAR